jgi:hypothetical protein
MDWIKRNKNLEIKSLRCEKSGSFTTKMMILAVLGFLMLFQSPEAIAQDDGQQEYLRSYLEERPVDRAWDRATNGLDYSKRKKKKERERREETQPSNSNDGPNYGEGSLVFLTLRLVGGNPFLVNRRIDKENINYSIEEVEADIHTSDLEGFARHALDKQDYKLAVRLYYLQIIKLLSQNKLIKWKRDKTNRAYINEMKGSDYFKDFRSVTRLFERVWYGDVHLQKSDFEQVRPRFLEFLKKIT